MSKTNTTRKHVAINGRGDIWENDRREQTAIAVENGRDVLDELERRYRSQRIAQDRDLQNARRLLSALDGWIDGGAFPEQAKQFACLHVQNMQCAEMKRASGEVHQSSDIVQERLDKLLGVTPLAYEENRVDDVEAPLYDALRTACGFTLRFDPTHEFPEAHTRASARMRKLHERRRKEESATPATQPPRPSSSKEGKLRIVKPRVKAA